MFILFYTSPIKRIINSLIFASYFEINEQTKRFNLVSAIVRRHPNCLFIKDQLPTQKGLLDICLNESKLACKVRDFFYQIVPFPSFSHQKTHKIDDL